jgi:hypothetical protein
VVIRTAYQVWTSARGLVPEVNDAFADDPDDDGRSNIEEFATDGDPLGDAGDGKARVNFQDLGGASYFAYTFPVRDQAVFTGTGRLSATADGIAYTLSGSVDPVDFDEEVMELMPANGTGLPVLNVGWSYRTFHLTKPVAEPSAGFILRLIGPPSAHGAPSELGPAGRADGPAVHLRHKQSPDLAALGSAASVGSALGSDLEY